MEIGRISMCTGSDAYNDALDRFLFDSMRNKEQIDSNTKFIEDYLKVRDTYIWRTREGKKIPVSKMENGHLKNAIRYLQRYEDQLAKDWVHIFKCELKFRAIGQQERMLERKHEFYNDIIAVL